MRLNSPKSLNLQRTLMFALFASLILSLASNSPLANAEVTINQTRYFGTDVQYFTTQYGVFFYAFFPQYYNSSGQIYWQTSNSTTRQKQQWGIRVYLIDENGTETQITSAVSAIVERTAIAGEGLQNATWNAPRINTTKTTDLLRIDILSRFYTTGWSTWVIMNFALFGGNLAQYLSESLCGHSVLKSTWRFFIYTACYFAGSYRWFRAYFGMAGYDSRIENIRYGSLEFPLLLSQQSVSNVYRLYISF